MLKQRLKDQSERCGDTPLSRLLSEAMLENIAQYRRMSDERAYYAQECERLRANKPPDNGVQQVRFELEGQHAQWPYDWSLLHGGGESEVEVRRAEWQFRDWSEIQPVKGWRDFRVVRVTTAREVLLSEKGKA